MDANSLNTIEVSCRSFNNYETFTNPVKFNKDNVAVYLIDIPSQLKKLSEHFDLLNESEQIKSERYRQDRDGERYIIAKANLRLLISMYLNIAPKAVEYDYNDLQKPFIKGVSNLNFNVSHSGEKIAIVFHSNLVGVDIEKIDEKFDFNSILSTTYSAEENLFVQNSEDKVLAFYKLWTRKEALVKAISKGIDDNFYLVPCLDGSHLVSREIIGSESNWEVISIELDKSYIMSIAYRSVDHLPEIKLFNWPINSNN